MGGPGGHAPRQSRGLLPGPQMKFLVNVTGHLRWKFSDVVFFVKKTAYILHMTNNFFSGDWPPSDSLAHTAPLQVEVLEMPLRRRAIARNFWLGGGVKYCTYHPVKQ